MRNFGINLRMNSRVTSINDKTMTVFDKTTSTTKEVPYGLIVWTTGVAPGPLAQQLLSKIPEQVSYRSLKTDSRCRVLGMQDMFAIGDCADINLLPEYLKHVKSIWQKVAQGKDRLVDMESNAKFLAELEASWPNAGFIGGYDGIGISSKILKKCSDHVEKAKPACHVLGLTEADVEEVVKEALARQKFLPPTAQVAQQQGEYLANLLSNPVIPPDNGGIWTFDHAKPFSFHNRGQLVYVGSHMAGLALPGTNNVDVTWNGTLANFVWHGAYFGMLESTSTRYELLLDWLKVSVFGRSTASPAICTGDANSHHESLLRHGKKMPEEKKKTERRKWF
jgi:NADH:ubiquinone reductase (non-electrogenic)